MRGLNYMVHIENLMWIMNAVSKYPRDEEALFV